MTILRYKLVGHDCGMTPHGDGAWTPYLAAMDRIEALVAKLAKAMGALEYYANQEIYKPHPHGLAFDRRDCSFVACAALRELKGGDE